MSIPSRKDTALMEFLANFVGQIVATPGAFGVGVPTATALQTASDSFTAAATALSTARANGVRSKTLTSDRTIARNAVLSIARELYGQIQDSLSVTDTQKIGLGIVVKGQGSPEPVPGYAPAIGVKSITGRTVRLEFSDPTVEGRKGRPPFTSGITIFSAVGEEAPTTASGWTFQGSTGKNVADVVFPQSVPAGSCVWFTAFYFNNRKQSGPLTQPVYAYLSGGSAVVTG